MRQYGRKFLIFLLSLGLGLGLMILSSEMLASPDTTVYWLGVALTLCIALASGAFALAKLYDWLKWAIETTENEETV
jgi:hypothetical protein